MEGLGFHLQEEATRQTLTQDVLKSSEIEGEILNTEQVRSSIARRLGMDVIGLVPSNRHVDGVVEIMLNATQRYGDDLSAERLFSWHAALFPTGRSGMYKIVAGAWRTNPHNSPMQVVSGPMGREIVHYQAPDSGPLDKQVRQFFGWLNASLHIDPVVKAGLAHLWFVTIHPFDDGNGRIARAITDMQLARADTNCQRFYSMSAQIQSERKTCYQMTETTQKGSLNVTAWLTWCLACFERALSNTDQIPAKVMRKAQFWKNPTTAHINARQQMMQPATG